MDWKRLPDPFDKMHIWGAVAPPFQFVLSYDETTRLFAVSAKQVGNLGNRLDIGEKFTDRRTAEQAAENFLATKLQ